VRVSLKSVTGVEAVDVSLAKGLASVKMKAGNTVTLKQLQSAITKNGFTMKNSTLTVAGTVLDDVGRLQLKVSGSNETVDLAPQGQSASSASSLTGKPVIVTGVVPETAKGKFFSIQYQSITEQK
jgi:copper chaperone CopZ